jgi:hypothetical protein
VTAGPGQGVAADGLEFGVCGADANLAQCVGDVSGRPRRLGAVFVAEQVQGAVGEGADVGPAGRAEAGEGVVPGGSQVRVCADWFGPDGLGRVGDAGEFAVGANGGCAALPGQPVERVAGDGSERADDLVCIRCVRRRPKPGYGSTGCGQCSSPAPGPIKMVANGC